MSAEPAVAESISEEREKGEYTNGTVCKASRVRQYEIWAGKEKFFCGGHLVTGPQWWSMLGTLALILFPSVLFVVFVVFPLREELQLAFVIISILLPVSCMSFLFCTGCMNPGIIPRNPPPSDIETLRNLPRTREVEVNGHMVVIRYNETCHFYQPPRAHHCSVIDDCIERFDHYCPWVGNTIGRRNYRFFLLFIFGCSMLCLYVFACSAYLVNVKYEEGDSDVTKALREAPVAVFLMIYVFICFWFVGGLSTFHIYLLSKNQTTYENIRYSYNTNYVNPYNKGCILNWSEVFCVKVPPSNVDFTSLVEIQTMDKVDIDGNGLSSDNSNEVELAEASYTSKDEIEENIPTST